MMLYAFTYCFSSCWDTFSNQMFLPYGHLSFMASFILLQAYWLYQPPLSMFVNDLYFLGLAELDGCHISPRIYKYPFYTSSLSIMTIF